MNIVFKTRAFYPDELTLLKALKTQKEKDAGKIKFHYYIIAGLLGTLFTYITTILPESFWTFIFGTLAVISFSALVFLPLEKYKARRKAKNFIKCINSWIDKGTIDTCLINSTRIALAKEYEDEGDLYIIEYDGDKILYLWDYDYNLRKKFPCLDFEIYDGTFSKLLGRQIYPLSARVKPLIIDKKAKWNYMKKLGAPEHLQIERRNFDDVIQEYNNGA